MTRLALITLLVAAAFVAAIHVAYGQAYSYRVTVYTSGTSSMRNDVKGKLKITFKGGQSSHKVVLSAE